MSIQAPNTSLFPEIDFASKCVAPVGSFGELLYPLSNAGSGTIQKTMESSRFFVGVREDNGNSKHIEMNLSGTTGDLTPDLIYT